MTNQTFHHFHDLDTELDLHRLCVVSMEHLQRMWHASRERLPFRTPCSVPQLWDLLVFQLLRPDSSNLSCFYSTFHLEYPLVLSKFCLWPYYQSLEVSIEHCNGCGSPTEDAYWFGHLVLSHLGLAFVLMLRPFFPELVMSADLLSFEHPSALRTIMLYRKLTMSKTRIFNIMLDGPAIQSIVNLIRAIVVLNTDEKTSTNRNIKFTFIKSIVGRKLLLNVKHDDDVISLVNVYAPDNEDDRTIFFKRFYPSTVYEFRKCGLMWWHELYLIQRTRQKLVHFT